MTNTANTKVRAPKSAAKKPAAKAKRPDVITEVKNTTGKDMVAVSAGAGTVYIDKGRMTGALAKLAVVGASFKAVQEYLKTNKPQAKLARGVDSHNAPHSAKAIADQKAPATAKGKERAVKADKAKAPSRGGNRAYTKGPTANTAREGTFRHYFIETLLAHKDEESAKAAHAKSKQYADTKFNFNWAAAQGYIVWK